MSNLQQAVSIIKSGQITGEETLFIDATLSKANACSILPEDTNSVLEYIDLQWAHNSISQSTKKELERLYDELRSRQDDT